MKRKFWNWIKNDAGGEEERTLVLNGEISDETWYGEYYPPWEPPVSRFRATRKFLP